MRRLRVRGMAVFGEGGHVDRRLDGAAHWVGRHLPKRVRYWTFISVAVQHIMDDEEVPAAKVVDVLQRAPRTGKEARR